MVSSNIKIIIYTGQGGITVTGYSGSVTEWDLGKDLSELQWLANWGHICVYPEHK